MKTGFEFIQRMQEDDEFRQKVNAFSDSEERLAFLKSEGYDFMPFVRVLDNLSVNRQTVVWRHEPRGSASPKKATSGFFNRFRRILRSAKTPRSDW